MFPYNRRVFLEVVADLRWQNASVYRLMFILVMCSYSTEMASELVNLANLK